MLWKTNETKRAKPTSHVRQAQVSISCLRESAQTLFHWNWKSIVMWDHTIANSVETFGKFCYEYFVTSEKPIVLRET